MTIFDANSKIMATYEGLIKIKGSLGDLVFYNLNGKNVVRKKSGFNKNAFKKSPAYEKVRQNSSEFGHCSKVGKIIRQAIDEYIKEAEEPLLYQAFTRLMTEIKDLDQISERGQRTVKNGISSEKGKELLRKFRFGKIPDPDGFTLLPGLWENSLNRDKNYDIEEITMLTLKIDFTTYTTEHIEEKLSLKQPVETISFQKYFPNDDDVFYFIIARNKGKITNMGFL